MSFNCCIFTENGISNGYEKLENESKQQEMTQIDTTKLAKTILSILKDAKIPRHEFAREVVGVSLPALQLLLHRSKPWSMCSDNKKILYQKMNEWAQSPEESIEALKNSLGIKNIHNIDTIEIANKIKTMLVKEKLPRSIFAKAVLGQNKEFLNNLINHPKPWLNCSEKWKELYIKMFEWNQAPQKSIESLKMFKSEIADTFEGKVELDTFDLVDRVNSVMTRQAFTKTELSTHLNVSNTVIGYLLLRPGPWHLLSKERKDHYTKMHSWLIQNEVENALDESLNKPMLEIDETDTINTTQVASEVVQMLKVNGISQGYFTHGKLRISSKSYFEQLVKNPKPYADLKESEKNVFRCMKKWTEPGKVKILKRDFDAYVAKGRIYKQNHNKKT
jgi:hypothetical protein